MRCGRILIRRLEREMEVNNLMNLVPAGGWVAGWGRALNWKSWRASTRRGVIENDWPEMEQGPQTGGERWAGFQDHVSFLCRKDRTSAGLAQDHAMTELSAMTTCRRTRLLENALSLPTVLWFVLIVGGSADNCFVVHVWVAESVFAWSAGGVFFVDDRAGVAGDCGH